MNSRRGVRNGLMIGKNDGATVSVVTVVGSAIVGVTARKIKIQKRAIAMKTYLGSFFNPCLLVACFFAVLYAIVPPSPSSVSTQAGSGKVMDEWGADSFGEIDARDLFEELFSVKESKLNDRLISIEKRVGDLESASVKVRSVSGGGGSTGSSVSSPYVQSPKSVVSCGGGSTGNAGSVRYSVPVPVRSGHWSYPGNLSEHLSSDHGVIDTSGMSQEDKLSLHDSLHESGGRSVVSSSAVVKSVVSPVFGRTRTVQSSNCPGGVCPTSSSSFRSVTNTRRGLFR